MKISLNWLQDFVDVKDFKNKPEDLAQILTAAGLEVEEIDNKKKHFEYVVTALILKKDKHPNADKLSVCSVMTEQGVIHQIVCGAQNHKADDKVVLALPNAVLPGDFKIKKSEIRGVESGGMLCSLKELGLATESQGILILPPDAPTGKPFAEYMGLDDVVFELKVTPNRADCLSHMGLAREIASLTGRPFKSPVVKFEEKNESTKEFIKLDVKQSEYCPRYCGRAVKGIKVGPSPDWLKRRLESVGLKSINNIVDVTNYIMFEMGQPLHAFDAKEINGHKIIVEVSSQGEKFISFDGTEIILTGDELTIRDADRVVALAGVVGGLNSGVSDPTTDIFIEAAYFAPQIVRKTSRAFGITTDSSYRFSRGVDPSGVMKALDRATELVLKVAGGSALASPHDFYPNPVSKSPITVSINQMSDFLGYKIDEAKFEKWMESLGCQIEKKGTGEYNLLPPLFRFDLEHQMDIVEEFARLNGYQHIPETVPLTQVSPTEHDEKYILEHQVAKLLVGQGFNQAQNMVFTNQAFQTRMLGDLRPLNEVGLKTSDQPIKLLNPLSDETAILRTDLVPGLIKNLAHNFNYGNLSGRIFELGSVFPMGINSEITRLGLLAWGQDQDLWEKKNYPVVFDLKAAIESILKTFKINSYEWVAFSDKGLLPDFLHHGQSVRLKVDGQFVGVMGTVHPNYLEEFNIRGDAAIGEFDLKGLGQPKHYRFEPLSKFPLVERDLAFLMPKRLNVSQVEKEIRTIAGPLLKQLKVFDVYQGEKLDKGQKSVAFRMILQDMGGTLTDEKVNELQGRIIAKLNQDFSISIR